MSNRHLLKVLLAAGLVLLTAAVVWVTTGLATRSCSLGNEDREQLSLQLSPEVTRQIIAEAAGPSATTESGLVINPAIGERFYALDQGPQRVCASGAALIETRSGTFNVLVRIYDSPKAARSNAESNLPQAPSISPVGDGDMASSDAVCQRRIDGECRVVGAQTVVGAVSVVALSRSLEGPEIVEISQQFATLVSDRSET